MYYFIYKTTNKINGKYYIGMNKTKNIDDGYLGSGKYFRDALKKYGEENFEREILEYCNSDEEMHNAEARYITEDIVNDKNSYNLKLGGEGGWDYCTKRLKEKRLDEDFRKSCVLKLKKYYSNISYEDKLKRMKNLIIGRLLFKDKLENDPVFKEHHSEILRKAQLKYLEKKTGKTKEQRDLEKISKKDKRYSGIKNSQFGTCWISNTLIKKTIKIKKEFLFDYIMEGWIKKRILKW